MALKVVIGYTGHSVNSPAFPVYVGHDGSAAEKAMKDCTEAIRFELFKGISGVRKSNPNYIPPAAPGTPPAPEVTPEAEAAAKAEAEAAAKAEAEAAAKAEAEAAAKAEAEAPAPDLVAEQQEAEAAADEPAEAPVEAAAEDALPLESTGPLSGKRRAR